ncbi:hypothetical protein FJZ26_04035 [Candidatus Parvarchaeota archaeon]|nr:hypothetical protein [Candidatus Parvarchaeota archaeon]
MSKLLMHTFSAYFKNLKLILFFSIPLLLAFMIPVFVKTPVYIALGGVFLRTGSIGGDVKYFDAAIMIISFVASLFLMSFATVNINLVIKSMRSSVHVSREVISGIGKYTLNVFWLFLTFALMTLIAQLLLFENPSSPILYPVITLVLSMFFFYCPSALVIDELRPIRAIEKSLSFAISKFPLFLLWLVVGFALIAIPEYLILELLSHSLATYVLLLLNTLVVMPFLIVLQTQVYVSKYTILP